MHLIYTNKVKLNANHLFSMKNKSIKSSGIHMYITGMLSDYDVGCCFSLSREISAFQSFK